ncbi:MAG: YkvA family protein [Salinibacter sp.]
MSTASRPGSSDGAEDPNDGRPPFFARVNARLSQVREQVRARRLDRIDPEYVEEGARRVTDTDLDTVVERAETIERRFRGDGPLGRLVEDGRLLLNLVRDARRGGYREVPVWTLSAAGFALLYVLNPFDLIPDALPVLGLVDDAAVVSACLALIEQDLYAYRAWRRTRPSGASLSQGGGPAVEENTAG